MKKEAWGQKGTSFHDFMLLRYEFAEEQLIATSWLPIALQQPVSFQGRLVVCCLLVGHAQISLQISDLSIVRGPGFRRSAFCSIAFQVLLSFSTDSCSSANVAPPNWAGFVWVKRLQHDGRCHEFSSPGSVGSLPENQLSSCTQLFALQLVQPLPAVYSKWWVLLLIEYASNTVSQRLALE